MKKILIYTAVYVLATTLFIPIDNANAKDNNGRFAHIDSNSQFPPTKSRLVRHTFRVHIPKNSQRVSELIIEVPSSVTWNNNINDIAVANENGNKISANVSINGKTILIAFAEPIVANTKLEIDIKNLKQPFFGNGPVYILKAKLAGNSTEIFVGTARFRIY
jgi:dipeptidase